MEIGNFLTQVGAAIGVILGVINLWLYFKRNATIIKSKVSPAVYDVETNEVVNWDGFECGVVYNMVSLQIANLSNFDVFINKISFSLKGNEHEMFAFETTDKAGVPNSNRTVISSKDRVVFYSECDAREFFRKVRFVNFETANGLRYRIDISASMGMYVNAYSSRRYGFKFEDVKSTLRSIFDKDDTPCPSESKDPDSL